MYLLLSQKFSERMPPNGSARQSTEPNNSIGDTMALATNTATGAGNIEAGYLNKSSLPWRNNQAARKIHHQRLDKRAGIS